MSKRKLWDRYKRYLCTAPSIGLQLDISRMNFDDAFLERMREPMNLALAAMEKLEGGAKANVDEDRMVGHYWLRAPELSPNQTIRTDIEQAIAGVKQFADEIHSGVIKPQRGDGFDIVLVIGIGGSALGPQFVADALGQHDDLMLVRFIDNTDPDGIDRTLAELDEALPQTLTLVISKSGATKEPRNAMLEVAAAYKRAGLDFARHAVAITCVGTALHTKALGENWLRSFPMWEWVGGRTSETSAVGLVPAALQGIDIDALLAGARDCDEVTRERDILKNPASLLALMWHYAGRGKGERDLVLLPYCDRLVLLGRHLQQLVMESLGKELDRNGKVVHQGITVFGNKGVTDQHAYVQQFREGPNNFFVNFITVRRSREGKSMHVEPDITTGDYLNAFWHGTQTALHEKGRESITLTIDALNARAIGVLIALFERAVGLYAELVNINAYHQLGVEAGKKAAADMLALQRNVLLHMRSHPESAFTAEEIAQGISASESVEAVFQILEHLSASDDHGVMRETGASPLNARYCAHSPN